MPKSDATAGPAPTSRTSDLGAVRKDLLREAQIALQSGQFEQAAAILRRILVNDPENGDAHMSLGILHHQRGDARRALAHLTTATNTDPRNAAYFHVMGEVHSDNGEPAAALECFDRALALDPNLPDTLFSRGNALVALDRLPDAIESLRRAVALAPGDAEAHLNLGNLLSESGSAEEAQHHLEHALALHPGFVAARVSMAAHHLRAGHFAMAIAEYDRVLAEHPQLFEALLGRGRAALKTADARGAVDFLGKAFKQRPNTLPLLLDLAESHMRLAEFDKACEKYEQARRLAPDSAAALVGHAMALRETDRFDDAMACLNEALERNPDDAEATCQLGICHQRAGRFEDAAALLRRAIELDPDGVNAYGALAADRNQPLDDETIAKMKRLATKAGMTDEDRATLHFALGQVLDAAGRYDEAFDHFRAGNEIRDGMVRFDVEAFGRSVAAIADVFDAELFEAKRGLGRDSDKPVFVVGMPRSGTTLIEQIIAAHPDAIGAGELGAIARIAEDLSKSAPYPLSVRDLDAAAASRAADAYLDVLTHAGPSARRVVDKMPNNFVHLGLIALLLPNAHIVHCRRDPLDTGLSCYTQNFGVGVRFSYDLAKIGTYYRHYDSLMAHWRRVLPVPVLEVDYEDLIADTEAQTRRLIEFLGLPWHDDCLTYYNEARPVQTASLWQARQPVYDRSIGRWRNYRSHLEPLRRALGEGEPSGSGGASGARSR